MFGGAFGDIALAFLAMVVAIAGLYLDELRESPRRVPKTDPKGKRPLKWLVILIAVGLFVGSAIKAHNDEKDKELLRRTVQSTLSPSNADYKTLEDDVQKYFKNGEPPLPEWDCYHSDDGMGCFLWSKEDGQLHKTLILNPRSIAILYEQELANESEGSQSKTESDKPIDKKISEAINHVCKAEDDPQKFGEDFKDKVGILGISVFRQMYHDWTTYSYDDNVGIQIVYMDGAVTRKVFLPPDELKAFAKEQSCDLFYKIELYIREKFKKEVTIPIPPSS